MILCYRLNSYGRQAFPVADSTRWYSLPRHLCDSVHTTTIFGSLLKI